MEPTPYLDTAQSRLTMKGKGAPRSTLFGVLGKTKYDPYSRTVGGLIVTTTSGTSPAKHMSEAEALKHHPENTERSILGRPSKTCIPGVHYGQVPYAGKYQSEVGKMVS
jgi:hypothetical protein